MEISLTQDILPIIAYSLAWVSAIGGGIASFFILIASDSPDDGKAFLIFLAIAICGGVGLFFLYGGSVTL